LVHGGGGMCYRSWGLKKPEASGQWLSLVVEVLAHS
jgi:hypothetical protein